MVWSQRAARVCLPMIAFCLLIFGWWLVTNEDAYAGYDTTAPKLNGVTFSKSVIKPGILKVTLDITEEETGTSIPDGSKYWCEFYVTHNSDFVVSSKKIKTTTVVSGGTVRIVSGKKKTAAFAKAKRRMKREPDRPVPLLLAAYCPPSYKHFCLMIVIYDCICPQKSGASLDCVFSGI